MTLTLDRYALRTAMVCAYSDRELIDERVMRLLDHRRYSYQEQLLTIALADAMWVRRHEANREMMRRDLERALPADVASAMALETYPEIQPIPEAFAQATLAAALNASERGADSALRRELAKVHALLERGEL